MRKLVVILAVGAIAAVVVAFMATRGGSSAGKGIVFQARVGGTYQLFTIDPDGGHLRVAFNSYSAPTPAGESANLFVIRPDGTGLVQLPTTPAGG